MKKTALLLMVLTIGTKVLGFLRDIVLSYFYGASNISDAYLISMTIPTVIFTFIGVGISTTFIPIFSKEVKEKGERKGVEFANNVVNILLIICTVIIVGVQFFTEEIVRIFASGFDGETLALGVALTRITIFSIYGTAILYVYKGYLQVKNNFAAPVLMIVPLNLILMIGIGLSTVFDLRILGYGKVLGVVAQILFLLPFLLKSGYRYQLRMDPKNESFKRMMILATPVILGTSVNQVNMLVDRTLASRVAVGGISALNYAHQLNKFVQGIFVMSIVIVLFATISNYAAEKNIEGIKKSVKEAVNGVNLLVVPTMVGAMIFAKPIVSLLFERGEFDALAVSMTSEALFFYSIGMVALGIREVLSRTFYSLQDTRTPMINAALGMALNIVLNFILVRFLGLGGLALATSIAAIVTAILMFISLRKKIGHFGVGDMIKTFGKLMVAAGIMAVVARTGYNFLSAEILSENLSLVIAIALGAISYFGIILFMKIEDVDLLIHALKKKIGR